MMVFTGNANPILAKKVVERLAIPLGEASISKFSDGEVAIDLIENVRGAFLTPPYVSACVTARAAALCAAACSVVHTARPGSTRSTSQLASIATCFTASCAPRLALPAAR